MANPARNSGLRPQAVGGASDQERDRQHHRLRGDDAGRHHGRRLFGIGGGELLSHQRQQRRIGEMKQHDAQAEDDQRPGLEQDAVAGGTGAAAAASCSRVEVSRPVVVDRLGRNGQHRDRRQHGEDRHEKEDGTLREGIADRARHHGDGDIAGMVEGRVPPHAPRQLLARVEAQGQGRDRGAEDIADDCHQAVGDHHRPEGRPGEDDRRLRCASTASARTIDAALGAGLVDRRADRRLDGEPEQAADRRHQADFGLAPMLLGDQEHVEIRPERAAHVGEQEIDGVERERVKAPALRSDVTATATASRSRG